MALRVRAANTLIAHADGEDPTVFINVEVFESTNDQVIAREVLQYSLAGMKGQTSAQLQSRVRDDAVAWAKTVKANAAVAVPLLTLKGVAVDIPDQAVTP